MAALELEIGPDAQRDLLLVLWESRQRWGDGQAERYRRRLQEACDRIARYPEIGSIQSRLPGVLAYPIGSHRIYYAVEADRVLILRILHQRVRLSDAD